MGTAEYVGPPTGDPVGVIGVGTMGGPIARGLLGAGRRVVVYDADAATRSALALDAHGLEVAGSAAEVARACEVVVLSLPTPGVVTAVVAEIAAATQEVTVLDTSTVGPETSRECREILAVRGGRYGDCPILGRPAAAGEWTIPVGGNSDVVAVAQTVLAPLARRVVGVGPTGAAATLKVLNNMMLGVINAATAEVLVLAEAAGLDPGVFVDTVVSSGAASVSGLFKDVAPRAVRDDFTPTFSLRLMHKDNALALDLADRHTLATPVARAAQRVNEQALDAGLGEEDSIAVLKPMRDQMRSKGRG